MMKFDLDFAFGIHSESLRYFRNGLALLAIAEGIKLCTIHSLMILSEHRLFEMQWNVWRGENSKINLFHRLSAIFLKIFNLSRPHSLHEFQKNAAECRTAD